jgi:hypothetical protein
MSKSRRPRIVVPVLSLFTVFAVSAHAQDATRSNPAPQGAHSATASKPPAPRAVTPRSQGAPGPAVVHAPAPNGAAVARGAGGPPGVSRLHGGPLPARTFAGQGYRGHLAWEGGHWRHEVHNGRPGWWWDVGGIWYWYPERLDGPPTYVSEDYADDVVYDAPAAVYATSPGAYPPPPPPPPPDPGASAIGGAIVGGVLGGLLTGRASGAAAGAVIGGATGAIAGATAASRPGYWVADGVCYYRYPSGQYVQADPRWCY